MARSAVLAGRTLADLVRNVFVVSLMVIVGFLVGLAHPHERVRARRRHRDDAALRALAVVGLRARRSRRPRNAEAAQAASFPILAPLVFASTAFVLGGARCPGSLQGFAKHQPVSIVIDAVRSLTYGGPFAIHGQGARRRSRGASGSSRSPPPSRSACTAARSDASPRSERVISPDPRRRGSEGSCRPSEVDVRIGRPRAARWSGVGRVRRGSARCCPR